MLALAAATGFPGARLMPPSPWYVTIHLLLWTVGLAWCVRRAWRHRRNDTAPEASTRTVLALAVMLVVPGSLKAFVELSDLRETWKFARYKGEEKVYAYTPEWYPPVMREALALIPEGASVRVFAPSNALGSMTHYLLLPRDSFRMLSQWPKAEYVLILQRPDAPGRMKEEQARDAAHPAAQYDEAHRWSFDTVLLRRRNEE